VGCYVTMVSTILPRFQPPPPPAFQGCGRASKQAATPTPDGRREMAGLNKARNLRQARVEVTFT